MFIAKKLFAALLLPPTGPLLLIIVGLIMLNRRRTLGRWLTWIGTSCLVLLAWPPVAVLLLTLVYDGSTLDLEQARSAQAIVVVAGGVRRATAEYGGDTPNWLSLERARYGAWLAHRTGLPVLVTGGTASDGAPEAIAIREFLQQELGVDVRWVESRSRNTHENAQMSARLLSAEGVSRVLLVAHGFDIRRARREFTAAGLEVIPAPTVIPRLTLDSPLAFAPSASALQRSSLALYELLGNLAMSLRFND